MAYCTIDELAFALRIAVTEANTPTLTACVDAAAEEIDAALDRDESDIPGEPSSPALINRDNVARAVQWYKANDVALGGGGNPETGILSLPAEQYVPMSVVPYKQNWGVA